jgi:hypothetical protein
VHRELSVQSPGASLGAGQLGDDGPPDNFELISHAGQQPVELLVAQVDLAGQEQADARLPVR